MKYDTLRGIWVWGWPVFPEYATDEKGGEGESGCACRHKTQYNFENLSVTRFMDGSLYIFTMESKPWDKRLLTMIQKILIVRTMPDQIKNWQLWQLIVNLFSFYWNIRAIIFRTYNLFTVLKLCAYWSDTLSKNLISIAFQLKIYQPSKNTFFKLL